MVDELARQVDDTRATGSSTRPGVITFVGRPIDPRSETLTTHW
jgi:hypothetical protein